MLLAESFKERILEGHEEDVTDVSPFTFGSIDFKLCVLSKSCKVFVDQ